MEEPVASRFQGMKTTWNQLIEMESIVWNCSSVNHESYLFNAFGPKPTVCLTGHGEKCHSACGFPSVSLHPGATLDGTCAYCRIFMEMEPWYIHRWGTKSSKVKIIEMKLKEAGWESISFCRNRSCDGGLCTSYCIQLCIGSGHPLRPLKCQVDRHDVPKQQPPSWIPGNPMH